MNYYNRKIQNDVYKNKIREKDKIERIAKKMMQYAKIIVEKYGEDPNKDKNFIKRFFGEIGHKVFKTEYKKKPLVIEIKREDVFEDRIKIKYDGELVLNGTLSIGISIDYVKLCDWAGYVKKKCQQIEYEEKSKKFDIKEECKDKYLGRYYNER
ncbi:MAG: hypothetical protein ACOC1K_08355 [Nanoarchaeota archaeon]